MNPSIEIYKLPINWAENQPEIIDEILQRWEVACRDGSDLTPNEICPDCPDQVAIECAEGIEFLKQFEQEFETWRPIDPAHFRAANYRATQVIDEGGQGVVLLADDTQLGRQVAIKILKDRGLAGGSPTQRLEQEARIAGMLEHPGVIPIYGIGKDARGTPFYAMRWVPRNHTLEDAISETHTGSQSSHNSVAFQRLLRHFVTVCRTVEYAHSKNVIHRDIKPSNILVGDYGEVFVMDFGIAKPLGQSGANSLAGLDLSGKAPGGGMRTVGPIGTPAYMSPEQAEDSATVGKLSDIYSLGATLYHLLTGRPPFVTETRDEMGNATAARAPSANPVRKLSSTSETEIARNTAGSERHHSTLERVKRGDFSAPHKLNPDVPLALDAVCRKAMNRDPGDRYASPNQLADEIERWLADEPVTAWSEPFGVQISRWIKRNRTSVVAAIAVLLVSMLGFAALFVQERVQRKRLDQKTQELNSANESLKLSNAQLATATEAAKLNEATAKSERDLAQDNLYMAHMNLASYGIEENNYLRVRELLAEHQPKSGDVDRRGFEWRMLTWLANRSKSVSIPPNNTFPMSACIAVCSDGKRFVTATENVIQIWNVDSQQLNRQFTIECQSVETFAISSDDAILAICSPYKIHVLDLNSGRIRWTKETGELNPRAVAVSPNGKLIAVGGDWEPTIRIYDAETSENIKSLAGHGGHVRCLAFSPDGARLASGDSGNVEIQGPRMVKLWDLGTEKEVFSIDVERSYVDDIAFSHDGKQLFFCAGGNVIIWDANNNQMIQTIDGKGLFAFTHLAVSNDDILLATGGDDRTIRIWTKAPEAIGGTAIYRESTALLGHWDDISAIEFSPFGSTLITAADNVQIWDLATEREAAFLQIRHGLSDIVHSSFSVAAVSPNVDRLAMGDVHSTISLSDTAGRHEEIYPVKAGELFTLQPVTSLAFSPDGNYLASGTSRLGMAAPGKLAVGAVSVWNAAGPRDQLMAIPTFKIDGLEGSIDALAFAPNGKCLATGDSQSMVRFWDVTRSGKEAEIKSLKIDSRIGGVRALAYSPDGNWLAVGIGETTMDIGTIRLVDIEANTQLEVEPKIVGSICAVDFSSDGKSFAMGTESGRLIVVEVDDRGICKVKFDIAAHNRKITSLDFAPDGRVIATGSADGTVKLWHSATGHQLVSIGQSGRDEVFKVAFRPDEQTLVAVTREGAVRIWKAPMQ